MGDLMPDTDNQTHELLKIVDRLVDNLQEVNQNNTEILHSVNISLTKVSETLPEIKTVKEEVITISTNLKIVVAIVSIVLALGLTVLGLYQSRLESNIVSQVSTVIETTFNKHIGSIEKQVKLLEDAKK
jgi:hypothetical protein